MATLDRLDFRLPPTGKARLYAGFRAVNDWNAVDIHVVSTLNPQNHVEKSVASVDLVYPSVQSVLF